MNSENPQKEIGHEVRTLGKMLGRRVAAVMQQNVPSDLTFMHMAILDYLYENRGHDIFQKDIERQFALARSSVTSILQLMEKNGYIQRVNDSRDARLKKILLTEKAESISRENYRAVHEQIESSLRTGLTSAELDTFFHCIDQMKRNLLNSGSPCLASESDMRRNPVFRKEAADIHRDAACPASAAIPAETRGMRFSSSHRQEDRCE